MEPKISVLMSVYNVEPVFLKEAIDSILHQTFRDFEFLIYDDGCNAEIREILASYQNLDQRIVLIVNPVNRGLTQNLADGVNRCRGEYICRQDADDVSFENRFQEQLEYMDTHSNISMLCTGYYLGYQAGLKKRPLGCRNPEAIKARLFIENSHILHSSVMMRTAFLREHNLNYDPKILKSQDYDLWTRIAEIGNIGILDKYLCIYRVSENQISTRKDTRFEQRQFYKQIIIRQVSKYFDLLSDREIKLHLALALGTSDERRRDVIKWFIRLIRNSELQKQYNPFYLNGILLKRLIIYLYKSVKRKENESR